jgi:drug/metabolite transporter (DMT)-like permease
MLSPVFLGMAPVLGKLAYAGGSDPFTVAAVRTGIAAAMLWVVYLIFARRYVYIFPAGLLGCVVVGTVNGIGSLMYYNGLSALNNASVAQLLNASYLIFVVILARFGGSRIRPRSYFRVALTLTAIVLLTGGVQGGANWLGIGLMIGNAICFAGTVILSQRVLYEMPAPTATLYVLTTMAVIVIMARAIYRLEWLPQTVEAGGAIVALGVTTALSRLTLFAGVKQIGSLQTVLIGILETGVALFMSFLLLGERFTPIQVVALVILGVSLLLARSDDLKRRETHPVPMVNMAGLGDVEEREAFVEAFVTRKSKPKLSQDDIMPADMNFDDVERFNKKE